MDDFQGKTAVVTGAASGIGLGMGNALGRPGRVPAPAWCNNFRHR